MNTPTLSFILIISISISIYGTTGKSSSPSPSPVFDTDEDEVKSGVDYAIKASSYIQLPGSYGWLSLAITGTCPLNVVQDTSENSLARGGLPLSFHPVDNDDQDDVIISTSTGLKITFNTPSTCVGTTWKMRYDGSLKSMVLTTGEEEEEEEFGSTEDSGWFKLEVVFEPDDLYKLVYCTSEHKCGDLYLLTDDFYKSKKRLVMPLTKSLINLHDEPFYVTITKYGHVDDSRIRKLPA